MDNKLRDKLLAVLTGTLIQACKHDDPAFRSPAVGGGGGE